jgi:hypothetical protein
MALTTQCDGMCHFYESGILRGVAGSSRLRISQADQPAHAGRRRPDRDWWPGAIVLA